MEINKHFLQKGREFFKNCFFVKLESLNHEYIVIEKNENIWNETTLTSSSGIIQNLFQPFYAKSCATNISKSKNFKVIEKYKDELLDYNPIESILHTWKTNGDLAKCIGSKVHLYIENFFKFGYSSLNQTNEIITPILNSFLKVYKNNLSLLYYPILMEFSIVDRKYPISGTIDGLFIEKKNVHLLNSNNNHDKLPVVIIDWKTANNDFTNPSNVKNSSYGLGPMKFKKDNKLLRYTLQQNIYRLILERNINKYNVIVTKIFLIVFFKDTNDYKIVPINIMSNEEIEECIIFSLSTKTINNNTLLET